MSSQLGMAIYSHSLFEFLFQMSLKELLMYKVLVKTVP